MKKFALYICFILYFLYHSASLKAQINSSAVNEIKSNIFKLNFTKADSSLQEVKQLSLRAYLNLYKLFVSNIVVGNIDFEKYCTIYDDQIDYIKNESKDKPFQLQFLSELYLQRGILEYQNENTFSAISYFSKAYSCWKDSEEIIPDSQYNVKLSGIFNLLIGNLPNPYSQMVSWFGYSGDTEKGFYNLRNNLVRQDIKSGDYYEALLYLGFSYLKFGKDDSCILQFVHEHASDKLPDFIQALMLRCANKIHQPEICIDIINSQSHYPILSYLQGKYFVQTGSESALTCFNHFFKDTRSMHFKADAFRYLSWYYLLKDDKSKFWEYQDSIKGLPNYPTSEDKQAKYECDLKLEPDTVLLKARMYFDIGRYKESKSILLSKARYNTKQDQQEYYYRLGRCYQYLGYIELALIQFKQAITLQIESKRYFGAYSALFAAKICFENKDLNKCRFFLNKAEELNHGEYKYSISQEIKLLKKQLLNLD